MTANFFQSLNSTGVDYLLISGQATVLYGAATFSEDIDLWLNPTPANREKFLAALHVCNARYYKLTPDFTIEHLVRGHGFHFILPDSGKETFLDVMGKPPRVGSFSSVADKAKWIETEWGNLHTIGIKDLIELKKTQRLEDYAIISKLVLAWFQQSNHLSTPTDLHWAVENIFTLDELRSLLEQYPLPDEIIPANSPETLKEFARQSWAHTDADPVAEKELTDWQQRRMALLQQADRLYWRTIIADLRQMRANARLVTEGTPV